MKCIMLMCVSATVPRRHEGRGHRVLPALLPLALGLGGSALGGSAQGWIVIGNPHPPYSYPMSSHDFFSTFFHHFFTPLSRRHFCSDFSIKMSQKGATWCQKGCKMTPMGSQSSPKWSQVGLKGSQGCPKCLQMCRKATFGNALE